MPYTFTAEQGLLTISLSGELGHHEAISIMAGIGEALDSGLPKNVVLDMSAVSFMDSSGIAVVVQSGRKSRGIGAEFQVRGAPPQAMRIFKAAGIDRAITFK